MLCLNGFHLLAARFVETGSEAGDLAFCKCRLQLRDSAGLSPASLLLPSHPGVRRLSHFRNELLRLIENKLITNNLF